MSKKIILSLALLLASLFGFSQKGTSSFYSVYGIGETRFVGTEAAKAMGGLAIQGDSIALNLSNPASYSSLRVTNLSVGGTSVFTKLQSSEAKEKAKSTSLDYLAIGVPMGKFGAAFGVMPLSSVGFNNKRNYKNEGDLDINGISKGSGNINKVFVGTSYAVNSNLSFGTNLEYNFGNLETEIVEFSDEAINGTRETNEVTVRGFSFSLGAMYNRTLNNKLKLYSSLLFLPKSKMNIESNRVTDIVMASGGVVDREEESFNSASITVPSKFTLGFGIGKTNAWLVGSEISFLGTKTTDNLFQTKGYTSEYENGYRVSLGGYYVPKFDSFSSYFKRMTYRAGFRYEKSGLIVNNESINDYGMNFGFGLPVGVSKIDLGFEVGKKGTTQNGLIQENYFNISVGLSLSDKWFRKVLID